MKIKDRQMLRAKSLQELKNLLKESKDAILSLRLEKAQNKLKNTRQIFWKKKDAATILSIIKEKEFLDAKDI